MNNPPHEIKCPHCKDGVIKEYQYLENGIVRNRYIINCPFCDGTGFIEAEENQSPVNRPSIDQEKEMTCPNNHDVKYIHTSDEGTSFCSKCEEESKKPKCKECGGTGVYKYAGHGCPSMCPICFDKDIKPEEAPDMGSKTNDTPENENNGEEECKHEEYRFVTEKCKPYRTLTGGILNYQYRQKANKYCPCCGKKLL